MFSGHTGAVFLGMSHMVAVGWQLGLESSEVTIDVGCRWGAQPGCPLEGVHVDWALQAAWAFHSFVAKF